MGTRIATIRAQVTAKDLSWSDTMRRIREETKRTSDFIGKLADGGGLGGLGGLVPTLDVGNIISRSVGALTDAYRQLAEARQGAEIKSDKAEMLGLTLTELQGLAVGAAFANTELETVTGAVTKFIRKLSEAGAGSKEASNDLALLGLTARDFMGMGTAEALGMVAERLNRIQNAGDRANASISLFGKEAGSKMITVLAGGSKALDGYIKRAKDLGLVLSDAEMASIRFANTQEDIANLQVESSLERIAALQERWLKSTGASELFGAGGVKGLKSNALGGAAKLSEGYMRLPKALDAAFGQHTWPEMKAAFERVMNDVGQTSAQRMMPVIQDTFKADQFAGLTKDVEEWGTRLDAGIAMMDQRNRDMARHMPLFFGMSIEDLKKAYDVLPPGYWADQAKAASEYQEILKEAARDRETMLSREAESLARDELARQDSLNAVSSSLATALAPRTGAARAALSAARSEQIRLSTSGGSTLEERAAQRLKDSQRMEQLTKQVLEVLKNIQRNTSNQTPGLSL